MRFMILLVFIASFVQAQTSITTIQGSDTILSSRTIINNNFSSLNLNKIESKSIVRDIRDYGAACNGVTDDSAAWASAIAAHMAGGTIRLTCTSNLGTTGIVIPYNALPINIEGDSQSRSRLIYTGTGAAITIGDSTHTTYGHAIRNLQIDITDAGANAECIRTYPSLFVNIDRVFMTSGTTIDSGMNNQKGLVGIGGSNANQLFGAYLRVKDLRLNAKFKKGIYLTATDPGWGWSSSMFDGMAVVSGNTPTAGFYGMHIHMGGTNLITMSDFENWEYGIVSEGSDNVFVAGRTEGNTTGVWFKLAGGGTVGGQGNRLIGGFHGDGVVNDYPNNSQVWATATSVGSENHITGFAYMDTSVEITGNQGFSWTAAGGGSSGMFWKNGTPGAVAGIYHNGTNLVTMADSVNVFTFAGTGVTMGTHLLFPSDENRSIGADGANRPENVYVKNYVKSLFGLFEGSNPLVMTRGGATTKGGFDVGWGGFRQWLVSAGVPAASDTLLGITEYTDDVFQGVRAAFFKGGNVAIGSTTDDGANLLQVNGNVKSTHLIGGGTAPTISSGFGTTPSIAGRDIAGRVTVGTSPSNTGTVAFGSSWATAPVCFAQNETTGEVLKAVPTTTDVVITQLSGSFVAADKVVFTCKGY